MINTKNPTSKLSSLSVTNGPVFSLAALPSILIDRTQKMSLEGDDIEQYESDVARPLYAPRQVNLTNEQRDYIKVSLKLKKEKMIVIKPKERNLNDMLTSSIYSPNPMLAPIPMNGQQSTDLVRSKYCDSTSKLSNFSLNIRLSPLPSAYGSIDRDTFCGPCDRIGRNYSSSSLGLTMIIVTKNVKNAMSMPVSHGKKIQPIIENGINYASTAPEAFDAKKRIAQAAKSELGKFPPKSKRIEPLKPLPSQGSEFALREDHRLIRTQLPYKTLVPIKVKSLEEYVSSESKNYDSWDPEPRPIETVEQKLSSMDIHQRIAFQAKAIEMLMEVADRVVREGIPTAAGSGHRLPIVGLTSKAIESILERIPSIPGFLDSNFIQTILNDELVQQQGEYRLAIAKSCVLYEIKDPFMSKSYGIKSEHLYDDESITLWTNKEYQLPEWRIYRQTGVDSETLTKSFKRMSQIHCNTLDIVLELQNLWLDGSLPSTWWDGMAGMTRYTYQNMKLVDVHEPQFRTKLPVTLDEFLTHVDSRCRDIRDALLDYWITTAGAKISNFLSELTDGDLVVSEDVADDVFDIDLRFSHATFRQGKMESKFDGSSPTSKGRGFNASQSLDRHISIPSEDGKHDRSKAERIVDMSCMLLSLQIRHMCEETLYSFLKLFDKLSLPTTAEYSIFAINLRFRKVRTGEISLDFSDPLDVCLQPDLQDITSSVTGCIQNLVELSRGFTRPEQAFGQGFGGNNKHLLVRMLQTTRKMKLDEATVSIRDEIVLDVIKRTKSLLSAFFKAPSNLLDKFKSLDPLMKGKELESVAKTIETCLASDNIVESLETLTGVCNRLDQLAKTIKGIVPDVSYFPMFEVHCSDVKELLLKHVKGLQNMIYEAVLMTNRTHMVSLINQYQDIANRLVAEVADASELRALQDFTNRAAVTLSDMYEQYTNVCYERIKFLVSQKYKLTRDDITILSTTFNWPLNIQTYMRRSYDMQTGQKRKLEELLEEDQRRAETEIMDIAKSIETLASNVMDPQMKIDNIAAIKKKIALKEIEIEKIHERETLLDIPHTDLASKLEEVTTSIEPLEKLWNTVKLFQDKRIYWKETPLSDINPDEEEKVSDELYRIVMKLSKDFEKSGEKRRLAKNVADSVLVEVKEFIKEGIPLMKLICNPGMRERHWKEIESLTGISIPQDEVLRMDVMLEAGLQNYIREIEDTCVSANKEYSLQTTLNKMEEEWKNLTFETKEYRSTGTRILCSVDEIQQLLDDQIVKIHAMRSSRYIKPFIEQVNEWEETLSSMQDIVDNWLKVQLSWLYLEPIFSSDDIMRQMPTEGKMFRAVDNTWRVSMSQTYAEPNCVKVARRPGFLESLIDANAKLEQIQKGLNDYLETKRLSFPRFFFLSNDELLEILSETKDPLRVQPHLKKCFDGIAKLEFMSNLDITACYDPSNEQLNFPYEKINHKKINPSDSHGNVERWLIEVEAVMKKSLAYTIDSSMKDFMLMDRIEWLQGWQGQVVICVNQTRWCADIEKIFNNGNESGVTISGYHQYLCGELLRTVELVRGNIPRGLRIAIGALVVMDVHNRDTTNELVSLGTHSKNDFDWLAQLRYYWNSNGESALSGKPGSIECRMINAMVLYAYEYIGNQDRLVITPLTDRCYRTLIGAIHLNLGGAPEGPAGTGKTETTKDLAKAIAIQCVVTNCSDGLDYLAMAKFFKGLASSGSWACFDEFNRIQLEVLSVIAQQILQIQMAKIKGLTKFNFEGTDLELKPTCCPFITMNPGYAGRAELPDNLKVLFRTVAMMVPDYAMISEIILYSNGYTAARPLAVKIVTTYKLCSEQLSSQSHYDYGMRAVIAVLRAAGNLKRAERDAPEDTLVLRSIIDVNLPKFLSPDVPLFNGIVSDLFPGVKLDPPDREAMKDAFQHICTKRGLMAEEYFWEKVVQIYDMMIVRHGFMIVGAPFAGKTSAWKVLGDMLGHLAQQNPWDKKWSKVISFIQNPKSITMGQLYGEFDAATHEWTDGVLAINYRNAASNKVGNPEDRKWIVFDGPVDALWIENLNTVLDDNKKLCLMSGEIIAMTDVMSMIFEPMDLLAASPATVSRCGMIYMEPEKIGWKPIVQSWFELNKKNSRFRTTQSPLSSPSHHMDPEEDNSKLLNLTESDTQYINYLINWLVEPCLCFVRKEVHEMSPTVDANLVMSMINIFEALLLQSLKKYNELNGSFPDEAILEDGKKSKQRLQDIECCFLFALIWSIGISGNEESQQKFSSFLSYVVVSLDGLETSYPSVWTALLFRGWSKPDFSSNIQHKGVLRLPMPMKDTVYECVYNPVTSEWKSWNSLLPSYTIPQGTSYNNIIVPSQYTAQVQYMIQLLIPNQKNILICGPTGTGKTVYINNTLQNVLPKSQYKSLGLGFSAKTSANMTQNIVDGKLDKRRKGVYGPPVGQKCIIFVDDLNLPEVELYGAQPPIELLRQLIDSKGWYDLKEKKWISIVDTCVIAAMGPAGGGRNHVTPRLLRHFNLFSFNEFEDGTLRHIFRTIVDWHFSSYSYSSDIRKFACDEIIEATVDTYRVAMRNLLPTPSKSHYTFNLRDFSRIVQGILLSRPYEGYNKTALIRLWTHETLRVFGDRLTDDNDRRWFHDHLNRVCSETFNVSFYDIFKHLDNENKKFVDANDMRNLIFGDYMRITEDTGENQQDHTINRIYEEIQDMSLLHNRIELYLNEYNQLSKKQMDLVMFNFAIEHISRISRLLIMPGGNALLVGVGGSGRQSLTRLATFMSQYMLIQIEISKNYGINEWRDDVKNVLKAAGTGSSPVVFLFSDTQIKNEIFVEDINNILNNGEVPNLFGLDDRTAIAEAIRPYAKTIYGKASADMTTQELYTLFVKRIKTNLHVVLAFSPIGDAFRDRLRKFPALINCCTIDWMTAWPADALVAVAKKFLSDVKFDNEAMRANIVTICQKFHSDVVELSEDFYNALKRKNYVTPTSYLELILAFKSNLDMKRIEVSQARKRYETGIEKLIFASDQVNQMHKELEDLQPELLQSAQDTEILMQQIETKMPGVLKTRQVVSAEAAVAQQEADIVSRQKNEVEADLAEAIPALEEAIAALNTIKTPDINEIKTLPNPPPKIRTVCKALCIMLEVKPVRIPDPENPSKRIMDYWGPSQKMLSDSSFISRLLDYNKDNINPKIVSEIQRDFIDNPSADFTPEKVATASKAAEGMCRWVYAMITYDRVAKIVGPKKAALAEAEAKLQATMSALNSKKEALQRVEDELMELQTQLEMTKQKKIDLEQQAGACDSKIIRATQLLDGLGGEKDRWNESAVKLSEQYIQLTGDVLISSGILAYLGPFTSSYRQAQTTKWIQLLKDYNIPCNPNPSLINTLGNPVLIRQWNIDGLPTDNFSVDNGIIVFNSRRWPLMIDPQSQANKWIRNMEKSNNLQIIKLTDSNYLRVLENSITYGIPVLLENIGEELDPSLEPLLQKQIFKMGPSSYIRLGDSTIEYNPNFRFYMTTKMRNPHYLPEISVKVTLLNFMITSEGLQDQLLGIVVSQERPDLEEQRNQLIVTSAENNRLLKDIEDKILSIMSTSSGNILEDETAIVTLKDSKTLGDDIKKKQAIAEETEISINNVRQSYIPVAYSSQILFFCIADLANIEPVYQYSLSWFINLFVMSINQSEKGRDVSKRLYNLNEHFTYSLYKNICRSLLEKHKLLFSFLYTMRIMMGKKLIDMNEWNYLLTGGSINKAITIPNPAAHWLNNKSWEAINKLAMNVERYQSFPNDFIHHIDGWKNVYDSLTSESDPFPGLFESISSNNLGRLCALKCIRSDKLVSAIQMFVTENMTDKYVKQPSFDILSCYNDSSPIIPLIFILSPGSDPMNLILHASEMLNTTVESISLGQGQGPKAEKLIQRAKEKGTWIVLQNCHLAPSWMNTLEKICEDFDMDDMHVGFRLWCTTYPSDVFPVSVLQNGVKMTNEPPKGIRANLLGSYHMDPVNSPNYLHLAVTQDRKDSNVGYVFRRLLFGLCFFHAIVQERRLYGPLGWNIPYEFNESDLRISVQQLVLFLNEMDSSDGSALNIPFKALLYTAGECNYGGRVTDDKDRRLLMCILDRFYSSDFLDVSHNITPISNEFPTPKDGSYDDYIEYIDKLPLVASPEVFGLHENATLTKDQNDTNNLLFTLLDTEQGGSTVTTSTTSESSAAKPSKDEMILSIASEIGQSLPDNFDMEYAQLKYPVLWDESMNTVLCQELLRFNNLLSLMRETLVNIQKAVKGLVVMSSELEIFGNSLFMNRIPLLWKSRSYPSLKPLSGYIADQQKRLKFFMDWLLLKPPSVYWISGFFFTQAFLTGAAQNFARRYIIPIDDVVFDFEMLKESSFESGPDNGVYTEGLFLEGARWSISDHGLAESLPKELFTPAPLMYWIPFKKNEVPKYSHYKCPVYKTSDRRGVLATTGHSSNFVCYVNMPSDRPESHWIQRGVAMLTQLDD